MRVYKPEWQCTFSVNEGSETAAGWRKRLAWLIRGLADRLDGNGRTLQVNYEVTPAISREEVDSCLGKGFAVSQSLMTQLAQQAACENIMREAKAELFVKQPQR